MYILIQRCCDVVVQKSDTFGQEIKTELVIDDDESRDLQHNFYVIFKFVFTTT